MLNANLRGVRCTTVARVVLRLQDGGPAERGAAVENWDVPVALDNGRRVEGIRGTCVDRQVAHGGGASSRNERIVVHDDVALDVSIACVTHIPVTAVHDHLVPQSVGIGGVAAKRILVVESHDPRTARTVDNNITGQQSAVVRTQAVFIPTSEDDSRSRYGSVKLCRATYSRCINIEWIAARNNNVGGDGKVCCTAVKDQSTTLKRDGEVRGEGNARARRSGRLVDGNGHTRIDGGNRRACRNARAADPLANAQTGSCSGDDLGSDGGASGEGGRVGRADVLAGAECVEIGTVTQGGGGSSNVSRVETGGAERSRCKGAAR